MKATGERAPGVPTVVGLAPDTAAGLLRSVVELDLAGVEAVVLPTSTGPAADPVLVASAATRLAPRIGLVVALSPWAQPPFLTARALSALDALSGGRAGWWVEDVAPGRGSTDDSGRWNPLGAPAQERAEALREMMAVCRGLWSGWDRDAVVADRASGRYVDATRVHVLDHRGRYFAVRGPLNCPPAPQPHPVLISPATSAVGDRVDVVVVDHHDEVAAARRDGARVLLATTAAAAVHPPSAAADGWFVPGLARGPELGAFLQARTGPSGPPRLLADALGAARAGDRIGVLA